MITASFTTIIRRGTSNGAAYTYATGITGKRAAYCAAYMPQGETEKVNNGKEGEGLSGLFSFFEKIFSKNT